MLCQNRLTIYLIEFNSLLLFNLFLKVDLFLSTNQSKPSIVENYGH